jgi:hypothetical protein
VCPDGSPVPGGPYDRIPQGDLVVGLAAFGARLSSLTFTVTPIDDLCRPPVTVPPSDGPTATLDGPGGGTWTGADGLAYCTADQTGGTWVLQIGEVPGRNISIVTAAPPVAAGPVAGASVLWGTERNSYVSAGDLLVTFADDLRSGTFDGTGIDATVFPEVRSHIEGTFNCGDGGEPLGTAAPWTGP